MSIKQYTSPHQSNVNAHRKFMSLSWMFRAIGAKLRTLFNTLLKIVNVNALKQDTSMQSPHLVPPCVYKGNVKT